MLYILTHSVKATKAQLEKLPQTLNLFLHLSAQQHAPLVKPYAATMLQSCVMRKLGLLSYSFLITDD